jgi:ATP-binding cassette subfamily B protein
MRESFSRITATLAESVVGIRVTQAFVRQDENSRIFDDLAEDHSKFNTVVMKTHGQFLPLLELNSQIFIALMLIVGAWRAFQPGSTTNVGDLVGFFFMANLFFAPISVLGNQYNQAMTAMAGAERLFQLLDTQPDWVDPPDALSLPALRGEVQFENVNFGYDPRAAGADRLQLSCEARADDRARRAYGQRERRRSSIWCRSSTWRTRAGC